MCHRLGVSLNAGVDIVRVLQQESERGTGAYQRHMSEVAEKVRRGESVAEAMRDSAGYFPQLTCELISVGEETGRLESVLLQLASHYEQLIKLRRTFLLGILWPGLELAAAILIIGGLIALPPMLFGVTIPVFGLSGARGAAIYFGVLSVLLAGLVVVGYGLIRGWFGPLPSRLMMHIPGVGKAIRTMALARHSWTLSIALDSGVEAGRAMRLALQSTQLYYFTRDIDEVLMVIQSGGQLYEALARTNAFPDDFLTTLKNAELSGTEGASLSRLSEEYQQQAQTASTTLAILASMIIWGAVVVLLAVMIVYLFMKLYMQPINDAFDMME